MAVVLYFNGIFNTLTLGLPMYWWVIIILGLIVFLSNVMWYNMFWKPLTPLHGLYKAYRTRTDAALLQDLNNNLKLVSEARAKVIFNETIEEAKKGEIDWKDSTSGSIGTVGIDIIVDIQDWTNKTNEDHHIVEEAADNWNLEHPEDQIHSYGKFMQYCEDDKIFVDTPTIAVIDWIRIESAFPKQRLKAFFAGYVRQLSEKMDELESSKLTQIGIYLLIASTAVSVLFAIGRYIK